jgi:sugar-specific transcriptional regulator TrmB
MEHLLDDLSDLGLSGYEAAVYLALLARNGLAPTEVATRARIPRQRIYDVLDSLAAKGLCTSRDTTPKTYFALDPAMALEALSQQRAEALERERERTARKAHDLIGELAPIFESGRSQNDPLSYIAILSEPTRIAAQALEMARAARVRVNACIKRPMILSQEQNWRFLREPLSRGVLYRALYERAALEDDELREWMGTFCEWGQEIRIVEHLPVKMQAFDDSVALLSMQDPVGGPPSFTAIAVRHAGTVAFLNTAFERLWESGEPFEDGMKKRTRD